MALAVSSLRPPTTATRSPVLSDSVPARSVKPSSLSWASSFPAINISTATLPSAPLVKVLHHLSLILELASFQPSAWFQREVMAQLSCFMLESVITNCLNYVSLFLFRSGEK